MSQTNSMNVTPAIRIRQALRRVLLLLPVNRIMLAVAHLLPKADWHARLPVAEPSVDATLPGGKTIVMANPARCQVAQELYWHNGGLASAQDRHALGAALQLSQGANAFLDIGSYSGLFALAVARLHPEITSYAYEIVGENYLLIQENVLRNDLTDRVIPQFIAVGAEEGEMLTPFAMGMGALASSVALDWKHDSGVRVPMRRLDDVLPDPVGPVAMKIDVEGFEMEVFDGAQRLLDKHKPDMICEVLRRAKRVDEMMEMLRAKGYRWLHITEQGFVPKDKIVADKVRRDWLLTTRTDDELTKFGLQVVTS